MQKPGKFCCMYSHAKMNENCIYIGFIVCEFCEYYLEWLQGYISTGLLAYYNF